MPGFSIHFKDWQFPFKLSKDGANNYKRIVCPGFQFAAPDLLAEPLAQPTGASRDIGNIFEELEKKMLTFPGKYFRNLQTHRTEVYGVIPLLYPGTPPTVVPA